MRRELPGALMQDAHWKRLERLGPVLSRAAVTNFEDPDLLGQVDAILAGWGCPAFSPKALALMPKLRFVAYTAASVKYFVTPEFYARGITVTSAHEPMAIPVAEFTLAAILFCGKDTFRFIAQHTSSRGNKGTDTQASWDNMRIGNNGKRVGIVGASRIGRRVIELLRPLDVEVRVYDPTVDEVELGVPTMKLRDLMAWADIVSLHAPAISSTYKMIGAGDLAAMRDCAYLINTARGWLVDHDALARECGSGRINAFIDTPLPDPLPPDSPFYDMPNVILSPHLAGAQGNELVRMTDLAITELERFAVGLPPLSPVQEEELDWIA